MMDSTEEIGTQDPAGEPEIEPTIEESRIESVDGEKEKVDEKKEEEAGVARMEESKEIVEISARVTHADKSEEVSTEGIVDKTEREDSNAVSSEPDVETVNAETMEKLEEEESGHVAESPNNLAEAPVELSPRDEELKKIGGEVIFERKSNASYNGWDNLLWMSFNGIRQVRYCEPMSRLIPGRKSLFWSGDEYLPRKLVVFDEPSVILVLRQTQSLSELRELLDLPAGSKIEDPDNACKSFLVVESVIDPKTCKLRLSPLTTVTSIQSDVKEDDLRRRSCFELITPNESVILSAVQLRTGPEKFLTSFTDSGAFLETSSAEFSLKKKICESHSLNDEVGSNSDLSWKHQIILGTLHSYVVLGNQRSLDKAIVAAMPKHQAGKSSKDETSKFLDPRIVDALDENYRSPLHYACSSRFSPAVISLVKAGANVDLRTDPHDMTPCHICAQNLDDRSLAAILSTNRRPNTLDKLERTPMYVAIIEGRTVGGKINPEALDLCLSVLESHGGQIIGGSEHRHPVSQLASEWRAEELSVLLGHVNTRYPLPISDISDKMRAGISLSASYQYPVHSSLIALRKKINSAISGNDTKKLVEECMSAESQLAR
jgi:hypothetical protein